MAFWSFPFSLLIIFKMDEIKSIFRDIMAEAFKPPEDGAMKLERHEDQELRLRKLEMDENKFRECFKNGDIHGMHEYISILGAEEYVKLCFSVMVEERLSVSKLKWSSTFSQSQRESQSFPTVKDIGFSRHLDGMQASLFMLEKSKGVSHRQPESRAAARASNLEFSQRMDKLIASKFGSNPSKGNEGGEKAIDSFVPVTGLRRRKTQKNQYTYQ